MSSYRLPDGSIPVLLSSETEDSLRREGAAVLAYLRDRPHIVPGQVADMLMRTRVARRFRALAMVNDREQLLAALAAVAAGESHAAVVRGTGPATVGKVGYIFPGQGSQRPGMGRLLYTHSPVFRVAVDECEAVFQDLYQISPLAYLLDDGGMADDVRIVQPALFMQMIGLAAMWQAVGVAPAVTVGHSQGEIAAACVSGIMSLADGIRVVTLRANLVDTVSTAQGFASTYSMAVVGVDREECERLLARNSGWAELSVINSAHVLAISGEREMVTEVVATLNGNGKFAKEIRVSYPAHTSFVSKFRTELCESLLGMLDNPAFAATEIDCIGAALGDAITPDLPVGDYWYWNLRNRVRFDLAIAAAADRGVDTFLEIADHPTLMLAVQENLSTLAPPRNYQTIGTSRRTATDLREFTRNLATVAVHDQNYRWEALRDSTDDRPPALPLLDFPNTRMNSKKLWAPYQYPAEPEPPRPLTTPQRLAEEWIRLDRRKLVKPRTLALIDPTGHCTDLATAIRTAAPRHGANVVDTADQSDTLLVLLPPPPITTANTTATVPNSPAAPAVDGGPGSPAVGVDSVVAGLEMAVAELAEFLGDESWLPRLTGKGDVWLVTTGGEQVGAGEVPDPWHAAAQAGFRALATEYLGIGFRHLDLEAGMAISDAAKALVGAIHIAAEPEIACRAGSVLVKRLRLVDDFDDEPLRAADLREVVIIGGTGKLGLEFCEHFAGHGAGRITLISRSGGGADAAARIERIRGLGDTEIAVRACDITDEAQVRALAAEFRTGPATLIVHAAVDYAAAAAHGPDAVRDAAAPKIIGLAQALRQVPRTEDCRIVLCSSLTATLGGRGNVIYGALNRMLDAVATGLRAEGIACSAVQWGLWPEVGAGREEALSRTDGAGLPPMDPATAIDLGLRTSAGNHIVAAAEWSTVRDLSGMIGLAPLFDELSDTPPSEHATEPTGSGAPAPGSASAGVPGGASAGKPGGANAAVQSGMNAAAPSSAHVTVPTGAGTVVQTGASASSGVYAAPSGGASTASNGATAPLSTSENTADRVLFALREVMGMDTTEPIDGSTPLVALGLDSLQALDLRKRIESELQRDLPVTAILGGASLDEVVSLLAG